VTTGGVLVLAGPPCAGKSSVAKVLATDSARSRRVLIEVDSLFSLLLPDSDRNRHDRMLAYDAAHAPLACASSADGLLCSSERTVGASSVPAC